MEAAGRWAYVKILTFPKRQFSVWSSPPPERVCLYGMSNIHSQSLTNSDANRRVRPPSIIMVKPLTFKGDKKAKKRKRTDAEKAARDDNTEAGPSDVQRKTEDEVEGDDSWVSAEATGDVVGPIMIVLPTDTPCALACDPSGKVFTLPIENIVDGNPATAEPHDVRQVWVANRVSGTESFRFKGHHGR